MALPIEGFTVVVRRERIQDLLDAKRLAIPNGTALADEFLWRISFMTPADAHVFVETLESLGINATKGPDSDAATVNEFDGAVEPYCEWLEMMRWEKAVIAWLAGTTPKTVTAREGWDPKVGSGLEYRSAHDGLELLRVEDNVEVYRDKATGKELYIGRSDTPVESLYDVAKEIVFRHMRTIGEQKLEGSEAEEVARAVAMIDRVVENVTDNWRVHWVHGKGRLALGNLSKAHESFQRAYELEKNEQAIARELCGACLELGKFDDAVSVGERAVALVPDDDGLLANLALAYLMARNISAAQKAIGASYARNAVDPINALLHRVIGEVAAGHRPIPNSMAELTRSLS